MAIRARVMPLGLGCWITFKSPNKSTSGGLITHKLTVVLSYLRQLLLEVQLILLPST